MGIGCGHCFGWLGLVNVRFFFSELLRRVSNPLCWGIIEKTNFVIVKRGDVEASVQIH